MSTSLLIGDLNQPDSTLNLIGNTDQIPSQRDGLTYRTYVNSATIGMINVMDKPFNAIGNGTVDDTDAIEDAISQSTLLTIIPQGNFAINAIQLTNQSLMGYGQTSILIANDVTEVLNLGWTSFGSSWTKRAISNLTIDGNSNSSNGLNYFNSSSASISGRWVIEKVTIQNCINGINKPSGNIGNDYRDCNFVANNFGYYALGQTSPLMHAGADTFDDCQFSGNTLAAIYINSPQGGTGGTKITNNTIIESNPGFGIFVKNYNTSYTPLLLDGVWFESNATAGSVTINSVSYTPVDLYLENTALCILKNGIVPKIQLVNSRLYIDSCFVSGDVATLINIDSNSVCYADNLWLSGAKIIPIEIRSIAGIGGTAGNFALRCYTTPRLLKSHNQLPYLQSTTFANADTYAFPGTGTEQATTQADGLIFDSCAELTIPAGHSQSQGSIVITSGKWYVFTFDIKSVSGNLANFSIAVASAVVLAADFSPLLKTGQWVTIASMSQASSSGNTALTMLNSDSNPQVIRFSAFQVAQFDTQQQAIDFYNSGVYCMPEAQPRITYSTVSPTTGTWSVGDQCIQTVPVIGNPKGWQCTVAGTPGTWVSMGNL